MLRIYPVSIEIVRAVRPLADLIARHDCDHARQLRRAALSVVHNTAEGSGGRGGTRTQRYRDALGSALEARAGLEAAEAIGTIPPIDPGLAAALNRVIGTLVRNVR